MKKTLLAVFGVFLFFGIIGIIGYSINKQFQIYGEYKFEKVSYLSLLSSSTADYLNNKMMGTEYTIAVDNFEIKSSSDDSMKIESPIYVKEEVPTESDVYSFMSGKSKFQYTIYDKDKQKTHLRIYSTSDCLWIAKYADNTANGKEIIMWMYKLSSIKE